MASYTATDGTHITVSQIVADQSGPGVFQAYFANLASSSGLVDQGFGMSADEAIMDLYRNAHSRQSSGLTPDSTTYRFR